MKIIRGISILILVLLAIYFMGGVFLPKYHRISKSIEIACADSVVYQYVLDYQHFKHWSPWYRLEPQAQTTTMGVPGKPGYTYAWSGERVGKGKIELIKSSKNRAILQELTFYMPKPSIHQNNLYVESTAPRQSRVSWIMEGANEGFFERWMYFIYLNQSIGKDFENGLQHLKEVLEQ